MPPFHPGFWDWFSRGMGLACVSAWLRGNASSILPFCFCFCYVFRLANHRDPLKYVPARQRISFQTRSGSVMSIFGFLALRNPSETFLHQYMYIMCFGMFLCEFSIKIWDHRQWSSKSKQENWIKRQNRSNPLIWKWKSRISTSSSSKIQDISSIIQNHRVLDLVWKRSQMQGNRFYILFGNGVTSQRLFALF